MEKKRDSIVPVNPGIEREIHDEIDVGCLKRDILKRTVTLDSNNVKGSTKE